MEEREDLSLETLLKGVQVEGNYPLVKLALGDEFQHYLSEVRGSKKNTIVLPRVECNQDGEFSISKEKIGLHRDHVSKALKSRSGTLKEWTEQLCGSTPRNLAISFTVFGHTFLCMYKVDSNSIDVCDGCGSWDIRRGEGMDRFNIVFIFKICHALIGAWNLKEMPKVSHWPGDKATAPSQCKYQADALRIKFIESGFSDGFKRMSDRALEIHVGAMTRSDEFFSYLAANKKRTSRPF